MRKLLLARASEMFMKRCVQLRMSGSRISALALCGVIWLQNGAYPQMAPSEQSLSGREKKEVADAALIRERVDGLAKAIRAKNIDGVMSFYAPNVVSFDIGPPLRYFGADRKRRTWQEAFAAYTGTIDYEVRGLNVATDGDLAFVYSVNHVKGTLANGHTTDMWLRWSACLRRIDGVWWIVHDHVSVPADLEHGRAFLNLTP